MWVTKMEMKSRFKHWLSHNELRIHLYALLAMCGLSWALAAQLPMSHGMAACVATFMVTSFSVVFRHLRRLEREVVALRERVGGRRHLPMDDVFYWATDEDIESALRGRPGESPERQAADEASAGES